MVTALNIPQFGVDNYEADDVIGTLSRQAVETNGKVQVIIVTVTATPCSWLMMTKLLSICPPAEERVNILKTGGVSFDEEAVKAKYGLSPRQVTDLKGLMGTLRIISKGCPG